MSLVGRRIELMRMMNDPDPIEPGTRGTITRVSANGEQISVAWDNGRKLMLVPEDKFRLIGEGPIEEWWGGMKGQGNASRH